MINKKMVVLVICFFILCGYSFGDIIHFKDGRKIEGEIISKDQEKVQIKTRFGTKEFLLTEIESIEEKKTKEEEYKDRLEKTDSTDVEALISLAKWCKEQKLESQSKKHLKDIIKLDPNQEEAREMLGYVKFEGKWVLKKELEALQAEKEREEKLAAGLVEYNGEWLPKEDVEKLKQGLVKYEGKWVTLQQKERLEKNLIEYEGQWLPKEDVEKMKQGLFKVENNWVKKEAANRYHSDWETPWELKSEHISLKTNKDYDFGLKMLAEGETAYRLAKELLKVEPDLSNGLINVYVTSTLEEYKALGNQFGDVKSSNYPVFFAGAETANSPEEGDLSVTYTIGDSDADVRYSLNLLIHGVVEQYIRKLNKNEDIPAWFINGQASKWERFFNKDYISWSLKTLRRVGGLVKFDRLFDDNKYTSTEQEIFSSGLICAYLDSDDVSDRVKKAMDGVLNAFAEMNNKDSKVSLAKEFSALHKALERDTKNLSKFEKKY